MIRLDRIYGQLTEAFKAGNRTRKKESAQNATESIQIPFDRNFVRKWLEKNLFSFLCHITTDRVHLIDYCHNDYYSMSKHEIVPDDFDEDEIREMFIPVHFWVRDSERNELCDWIMAIDVFDGGMEIRGMDIEGYDDFGYTCRNVDTINFVQKFHETLFEIQRQLEYEEPVIEDPNNPVMTEYPFKQYPVNEAFKAGNRSRKKESAQDAVEDIKADLSPEDEFWKWERRVADMLLKVEFSGDGWETDPEYPIDPDWYGVQIPAHFNEQIYYGKIKDIAVIYQACHGLEFDVNDRITISLTMTHKGSLTSEDVSKIYYLYIDSEYRKRQVFHYTGTVEFFSKSIQDIKKAINKCIPVP